MISDFRPQLAMPVKETSGFGSMLEDPNFVLTQKVDGERRLVLTGLDSIRPLNRSGGRTEVPRDVHDVLSEAPPDYAIDGELIGGVFWAFDMPYGGAVVPETPYRQRRLVLEALFDHLRWNPDGPVRLLPTAETMADKVRTARRLLDNNAEGVMFNHVLGLYVPGRNDTRSPWLFKFKYTKDADCVIKVRGVDGKDNFGLVVYDANGKEVYVGEVSALTGDGPLLDVGEVCTVTYLYATEENKLYQPVKPRRRTDKAPEACLLDQLIYTRKEVLV